MTKEKSAPKKELLNVLVSWRVKEERKNSYDLKFLIIASSVLFALVAFGLFTNNLLMSVLFILIGFTLYLIENKEPETGSFAITEEGFFDRDKLYEFDSLESFWINYEPGKNKEIILKSKSKFLPYIKAPLGNQNPIKIRKLLLEFLPEKEHQDPVGSFLEKYF
jgi:hypothetical protein